MMLSGNLFEIGPDEIAIHAEEFPRHALGDVWEVLASSRIVRIWKAFNACVQTSCSSSRLDGSFARFQGLRFVDVVD